MDALYSLVVISKGKAVPWIIHLLDDPDPAVRVGSLEYIAFYGGPAVLPRVRKMLQDSEPLVRLNAGRRLARAGEILPRDILTPHLPSLSSAPLQGHALDISQRTLELLAYLGEKEDLPLLEAIITRRDGRRGDRRRPQANFARRWILYRLADTDAGRMAVLGEMFRERSGSVATFDALSVPYRRGDPLVRRAAKAAAEDTSNPMWIEVREWIKWMSENP